MSLIDIIDNAIIILLPFLVAAAWLLFKKFEAGLPANMQALLNSASTMAVQQVEQQYTGMPSATKKNIAMESVKALFDAVHLPSPDTAAISLAIESAVFLLNQSKQPSPDPMTVSATPPLAPNPQPIVLPTSQPKG